MNFKNALQNSLKSDPHTRSDPFLLYSRVSDLVGGDYNAKKAAEQFYRLDARYEISKAILASAPVKYKKRKKRFYKVKPLSLPSDNAYVYFVSDFPTLHLSGECPCLQDFSQIYRTTYDHARFLDLKKKYFAGGSRGAELRPQKLFVRRSKYHTPPICPRCAAFAVRKTNSIFYKVAKWIFDHFSIDIHRKTNYSPTSFELFKARLRRRRGKR